MATQNIPSGEIITSVEIDAELAHRLSDLLTTRSIRESLMMQLLDNPESYMKVEKMLMPIVEEIDSIKNRITGFCIPEEYRDPSYTWTYEGWTVDENRIYIRRT